LRLAPAPRPWVKICGVTHPEDAAAAAALGAAMVGINFWPRSPRFVADPARAREIADAARPRALVAGVFVDEDPLRIEELVERCGLDLVQLHGDEPDEVLARFAPRAIRALRAERATRSLSVQDQDQDRDRDQRLSVAGKGGEGSSVAPGGGVSRPVGAAGRTTPGARGAQPSGATGPGSEEPPFPAPERLSRTWKSLRGRATGEEEPPFPAPESLSRRWEFLVGGAASEEESPLPSPGSLSVEWKSLPGGAAGADRQPRLEQKIFCWLLDGPAGARYGGTGEEWDWALARPAVAVAAAPVLVAGGIRPDNVRRALAASGAAGVDVASGVERSPGVKDRELLERFFEEVARVRE